MKVQFPVLLDELKFVYKTNEGYAPSAAYEIIIYGNGRVEYEGNQGVKTIGKKNWRIDKNNILKLLKYAIELGIFELDSEYIGENRLILEGQKIDCRMVQSTDLASSTLELHISKKIKKVYNYQGAPKRLEKYEKLLVKLSGAII